VRGVLLCSAHPKLFCPGLDLLSLESYDAPALTRFMLRFAEMVWALFDLPKPLVAAVSGHAVAGGCILALTADERILRQGASIGLNEVKIGVPLACVARMARLADKDPAAFGATKRCLREGALAEMKREEAARAGEFIASWFSPATTERRKQILASLKKS
jgi:enoyl-CoA hydratase/carnithine racemase